MTERTVSASGDSRESKMAKQLETLQKFVARMSAVSAFLAAWVLSKLYFMPQKSKRRICDMKGLTADKVEQIAIPSGRSIRFHSFGIGPKVMLVHGWSGWGAQWQAFVGPLVQRGYQAVVFDASAHGESVGTLTDTIEIASCITAYVRKHGPLHGVVAHSFGSGAVLYAAKEQAEFKGLACIGTPDPTKLFLKFVYMLKVPAKVSRLLKGQLERKYRKQGIDIWKQFSLDTLRQYWSGPIFLVQDEHDEEVPPQEASIVAALLKPARQLTTSGLGHYRVLLSTDVVDQTLSFLDSLDESRSPERASTMQATC